MSRSCSREIPSVYFFSHSARSLSLVSIVVQLSISLYPFFCLLFVFESFDSTFSNLFPTAAKLLLHLWISCSKEISSVYFLSVRLSLFYLFLLFVFESFDWTFTNLFPTAAKLLLWIVIVVEKFLSYISSFIPRDLYLYRYSFSLICLRIFRFNVSQSFSNKLLHLWIVEKFLAHISSPILRDLYLYRYSFSLICLRIFRFNVSQFFSQQIIIFMNRNKKIPYLSIYSSFPSIQSFGQINIDLRIVVKKSS